MSGEEPTSDSLIENLIKEGSWLSRVAAERLRALERERDEKEADLIIRQGDLLTAVVNAIRGEPPEDTLWSHHDAGELAEKMAAENAQLRADSERLAGAIETLVADEIISAGRARELHGMSVEEQRGHWRDRCTHFLPIHLEISPKGEAVVRVEYEGDWVEVIRELHIGGVTSHIVEASGIRSAADRHRAQQAEWGGEES